MSGAATPDALKSPLAGGAAMQQWLTNEKIVRGWHKPPSKEACEELSELAQGCRMLIERQKARRGYDRRATAIRQALEILAESLPSLESDIKGGLETLSQHGTVSQIMRRDLTAVESLSGAVRDALRRPLLLTGYMSEPVERWHDFACDFAEAFGAAMAKANPGADLKPSNTGPVVRFLEAIIPMISREEPTQAAIARYLQRAARG